MTQTENSAVRTRDEQIEDLTNLFGEEGTFTFVDDRDAATKHILEAEARGAEEQRRKDGEGVTISWLRFIGGRIEETTDRVEALKWTDGGRIITEYRPANVAALEGERDRWRLQAKYETDVAEVAIQRGKDLETKVKGLEADRRKDQEVIHWLAERLKQTDPEAKSDYELLARAALTREGGE